MTTEAANPTSNPEPLTLPLIGNSVDLDFSYSLGSFLGLAERIERYADYVFPARDSSSHMLEIANAFTMDCSQHTIGSPTGVSHRVLVPAFGPMSIRDSKYEANIEVLREIAEAALRERTGQTHGQREDLVQLYVGVALSVQASATLGAAVPVAPEATGNGPALSAFHDVLRIDTHGGGVLRRWSLCD
ncbi:hypothetical protein F5X99DRAFT_413453 [Biscogniauxia marginata]|nr:hypothetical protein F5X99DRAFT_413453 [Biscogniauxia marginata]